MSEELEVKQDDMSPEIGELAAALAKAQGAIEGAKKDANNPHFKSSYATLDSIWDACREEITKNGLAVVQSPEGDGTNVVLVTTLIHSSGQWMRGRLPVKPTKDDPQGVGSAVTYCRRYALAAFVGIAPEDDDGEAASGRGTKAANHFQAERDGILKSRTLGELQTAWENLSPEARKALQADKDKRKKELESAND